MMHFKCTHGYTAPQDWRLEAALAWCRNGHPTNIQGRALDYEQRITDPVTGGQKGQKLAELGGLDPQSLMEVAKVSGYGSKKYDRYNFLKGYRWSLSYDALQRHLHAFWGGEWLDPESGLPHLAHAGWHILALLAFHRRGLGTDDRP
jgi:hypothetical protein